MTENAGIGIKEYRNRKCPGQDPGGQCAIQAWRVVCKFEPQERFGFLDFFIVTVKVPNRYGSPIQRIDEHGKKAQLHVLPGRFTDREKEPDDPVLPGPSVDKMCQRAGDEYKYCSNDQIAF